MPHLAAMSNRPGGGFGSAYPPHHPPARLGGKSGKPFGLDGRGRRAAPFPPPPRQ
ncbi:hypothetical protein [Azospirillum largimobile]